MLYFCSVFRKKARDFSKIKLAFAAMSCGNKCCEKKCCQDTAAQETVEVVETVEVDTIAE